MMFLLKLIWKEMEKTHEKRQRRHTAGDITSGCYRQRCKEVHQARAAITQKVQWPMEDLCQSREFPVYPPTPTGLWLVPEQKITSKEPGGVALRNP